MKKNLFFLLSFSHLLFCPANDKAGAFLRKQLKQNIESCENSCKRGGLVECVMNHEEISQEKRIAHYYTWFLDGFESAEYAAVCEIVEAEHREKLKSSETDLDKLFPKNYWKNLEGRLIASYDKSEK